MSLRHGLRLVPFTNDRNGLFADIACRMSPRQDIAMGRGVEDWAEVKRAVAEVVAARPDEYEVSVVRNLDDLLAHIQKSNRPAPSISAGYWPTFLVEWEAEELKNLQIEVFEDRYEVSRFFDGRTDIWYEPHAHGDTFSDQLIAELPKAG
ncbi:MAG: hypothetical protein IBJ02_04640 [Brevundimonas sp.]|nr:hypothetical protein [Brevundimonas sp.]